MHKAGERSSFLSPYMVLYRVVVRCSYMKITKVALLIFSWYPKTGKALFLMWHLMQNILDHISWYILDTWRGNVSWKLQQLQTAKQLRSYFLISMTFHIFSSLSTAAVTSSWSKQSYPSKHLKSTIKPYTEWHSESVHIVLPTFQMNPISAATACGWCKDYL